jgi:hypothetical protein
MSVGQSVFLLPKWPGDQKIASADGAFKHLRPETKTCRPGKNAKPPNEESYKRKAGENKIKKASQSVPARNRLEILDFSFRNDGGTFCPPDLTSPPLGGSMR